MQKSHKNLMKDAYQAHFCSKWIDWIWNRKLMNSVSCIKRPGQI